jgi:hypothetical protein
MIDHDAGADLATPPRMSASATRVKTFVAAGVLGGAALACNQVQLQEPPEASVDACVAHTITFCDPDAGGSSADGAAPAFCGVQLGGDAGDLPADASYPVGCTAHVLSDKRDPVTGVCALSATCTCTTTSTSDASSAQWACTP